MALTADTANHTKGHQEVNENQVIEGIKDQHLKNATGVLVRGKRHTV